MRRRDGPPGLLYKKSRFWPRLGCAVYKRLYLAEEALSALKMRIGKVLAETCSSAASALMGRPGYSYAEAV